MVKPVLIPPQLRDSNFGCVCVGTGKPQCGVGVPREPPAHHPGLCVSHTETLCVSHTDTVSVPHRTEHWPNWSKIFFLDPFQANFVLKWGGQGSRASSFTFVLDLDLAIGYWLQFLCVEHTQSWVRGGRRAGRRAAGGSRGTPTPHWGFPVPPTHTPKIAIPQLRGDKQWVI